MAFKSLKWIYRALKWIGIGTSVVSAGSFLAVPLIAKELAENFLEDVIEGSTTEIFGKTIEVIVENENELFKIEGIKGLLSKHEALEELTDITSSVIYSGSTLSFNAGTVLAELIDKNLSELEKEGIIQTKIKLINQEAENNFEKAKKIFYNYELSKKAKHNCNLALEKIRNLEGVYKTTGIKWLLSENVKEFNKNLLEFGNDFYQEMRVVLLLSDIDIIEPSPLFETTKYIY